MNVFTRKRQLIRYVITLATLGLAVFALFRLWAHYEVEPWTRDARVRASVVAVSPDVSGLVTRVYVKDNSVVKQGDPLFAVDPERYQLAYEQAVTQVTHARISLRQAKTDYERNRQLIDVIAQQELESSRVMYEQALNNVTLSKIQMDSAKLNLTRSTIVAPHSGQIVNLELREGAYVNAGHPALALIENNSFYIEAYFEETKLAQVHVGNKVRIRLMGFSDQIEGEVESITMGVADKDRGTAPNLLPSVSPNFNWVRLAQRIPVRVRLTHIPKSINLIAGQTATVSVVGH